MRDAQLEKMTVKELEELRERVDDAIVSRMDREKTELKERMMAMASEHGFDVRDLFGARGARGGRGRAAPSGIAKYRNSDDNSQTWSGRGRKPNWLTQAGGDQERFRIKGT